MRFLDVVLGRTRPVPPKLDTLFAIPGAALTLQTQLGLAATGAGAVCFKHVEGTALAAATAEIRALLGTDPTIEVVVEGDEYGYLWVICRQRDVDLSALVTDLHGVNTTLIEAGFGANLLCTVVAFADRDDHRLGLVYLYKRGTVYPFAPLGRQRRDTELELRARAALDAELPIEPELARWFPLWGAPVPG